MKRRLARVLLMWLVRHCYYGITEKDFVDPKMLRDSFFETYSLRAKDVYENDTFQNELKRLQYQQERYLVNKSKNDQDLVFARASLYIIDLLKKRFKDLTDQANELIDTTSEDHKEREEALTEY